MTKSPKPAPKRETPHLYLVTPVIEDAAAFVADLTQAMAGGDVVAVLLRLKPADERTLLNRIKALARAVQDNGAALVLHGHADLVARAGADGAQLSGLAAFEADVERLKPDRIAGCSALETRHDGMVAAETGADYVMFGEPLADGRTAPFEQAIERVEWWAEVFEVPCVAYAATPDQVAPLAKAGADFIALGDWLWTDRRGATAAIADAMALLRAPETAA